MSFLGSISLIFQGFPVLGRVAADYPGEGIDTDLRGFPLQNASSFTDTYFPPSTVSSNHGNAEALSPQAFVVSPAFNPTLLRTRELQLSTLAAILCSDATTFEEGSGNALVRWAWRDMFGAGATRSHEVISQDQFERIRDQILSGRSIREVLDGELIDLYQFGLSREFIEALYNPNIPRESFIEVGLSESLLLVENRVVLSESKRGMALFDVLEGTTRDPHLLETILPNIRNRMGGEERLRALRREMEDPSHWMMIALGVGASETAGRLATSYVVDHAIVRGAAGAFAFPLPATLIQGRDYQEQFISSIPLTIAGPLGRAAVSPWIARWGSETLGATALEFGAGTAMINGVNVLTRPNETGSLPQELFLAIGQETQGRIAAGIWQGGASLVEQVYQGQTILGRAWNSMLASALWATMGAGVGGGGILPRKRIGIPFLEDEQMAAMSVQEIQAEIERFTRLRDVRLPPGTSDIDIASHMRFCQDQINRLGRRLPPASSTSDIPEGFVRIPAGRFRMGDSEYEGGYPEEQPNRTIEISRDFYLQARPVTVQEYRKYVEDMGEMGLSLGLFIYFPSGNTHLAGFGGEEETTRSIEIPMEIADRIRDLHYADENGNRAEFLAQAEKLNDILGDTSLVAGIQILLQDQPSLFSAFDLEVVRVVPPRWEYDRPEAYNDHPAVNVNWFEANAYGRWRYGLNARLPTEAEWEYAARGGRQYTYASPARGARLEDMAHYEANNTAPVNSNRPPSLFGLFDMTGNVQEWTSSGYEGRYYERMPARDPMGAVRDPERPARVLRGGGWTDVPRTLRNAARNHNNPRNAYNFVGFRLAFFPSGN